MHFALAQVAPSLCYDRQTVEGVRLGSDCSNALGVRETPLVTQVRRFGLALFPVDGSLPAQDVGEKRVVALLGEKSDSIVEQSERLLSVAGPLSHLCPFNELASLVQSASPLFRLEHPHSRDQNVAREVAQVPDVGFSDVGGHLKKRRSRGQLGGGCGVVRCYRLVPIGEICRAN